MGTSKSYEGPTGHTPLLPPWAPDPPPELDDEHESDDVPEPGDAPEPDDAPEPGDAPQVPEEGEENLPKWSTPKSAMTRYASTGGQDIGHVRRAGSGFVSAQGGARRAAAGSISGRQAAVRIGGAFAVALAEGAAGLLRLLGAQHVGGDIESLLSALVDAIAPAGALAEEAAARAAAAATIADLFELYGVDEDGLAALDDLPPEAVGDVLERYTAEYVFTRLMETLASRVENGARSAQEVCRMERDLRAYVTEQIRTDLADRDVLQIDWSGPEAGRLVESVFTEAYTILEAWQ